MAVMGTDSVILDDLRGRVAELEALVPRLFSVIAEKDAIIAKLTATVKAPCLLACVRTARVSILLPLCEIATKRCPD